jgi:hypothetical protein
MMSWDPSLLSFSTPSKKNQETTRSLLAPCHLLHIRKKPRNDNKLGGSSLSFTPKEENVENDNELGGSLSFSTTEAKQPRMITSRDPRSLWSLTLEEKNQEMTMRLLTCRCFFCT